MAAAIPDSIPSAQIARLPPYRGSKAVYDATGIRDMTHGVVGRDGSRLKLMAVRLPGSWRSTWPRVAEFIEAITLDRTGTAAPPVPGSRRAIEQAERYLAASGFGRVESRS